MRPFFALLALFVCTAAPASAQQTNPYEFFNNPELESNMTRSMMLPTSIVDMPKSLGSGTVIFSGYLDLSQVCALEKPQAMPTDTLCAGDTTGQKQERTYVLTAWHVLEKTYFPPPPKPPLRQKSTFELWLTQISENIHGVLRFWTQRLCPECVAPEPEKKQPPRKMVDKPPEMGIIVRVAASSGEMDIDFARHSGALVAYDEKRDLALVRVLDSSIFPFVASVAPRDVSLHPARIVWSVGAPYGYGPELTEGHLSGTHERVGKDVYTLTSSQITHGNSGGGLYHWSPERKRFELIGVSHAIGGDATQIDLSIRISEIHDFLKEHGFEFLAQ